MFTYIIITNKQLDLEVSWKHFSSKSKENAWYYNQHEALQRL